MIQKKKIIRVPANCIADLAKTYGFTRQAVYNALAFRNNSTIAQKIRKDALENYGGIKADAVYF
jgi:hypothetical protein